MLKFLFWVLLLSNAALFAYGKGYSLLPEEHEPDHMARQINPESVKLVPASLVEAKSGTASAGAAAAAKAEPASCSEFGSLR